ncbi:NUDIX hydrolase [Nocardia sp. GCM10030253]|uniref:NUDIX hydrolase n=1 Tax=Nocardia sp. GCM10030253 TaxID=3273404 RepID=UPI003637CBE0
MSSRRRPNATEYLPSLGAGPTSVRQHVAATRQPRQQRAVSPPIRRTTDTVLRSLRVLVHDGQGGLQDPGHHTCRWRELAAETGSGPHDGDAVVRLLCGRRVAEVADVVVRYTRSPVHPRSVNHSVTSVGQSCLGDNDFRSCGCHPAGHVDPGENPLAAAQREARVRRSRQPGGAA